MADSTFTPEGPGFFIDRHYLSDLSVEAPFGRVPDAAAAQLQLGHQGEVKVFQLAEADLFQVDIGVRLVANLNGQTIFLAELTYRAEVRLHQIAEENRAKVLQQEVPFALQPVLARILEQNGTFAGYPEMKVGDFGFMAEDALTKAIIQTASEGLT